MNSAAISLKIARRLLEFGDIVYSAVFRGELT